MTNFTSTRLYAASPRAALPRHDAASPRAATRGLASSQGGFAARGFAATHGRGHVSTTINIEMSIRLFASKKQPAETTQRNY